MISNEIPSSAKARIHRGKLGGVGDNAGGDEWSEIRNNNNVQNAHGSTGLTQRLAEMLTLMKLRVRSFAPTELHSTAQGASPGNRKL